MEPPLYLPILKRAGKVLICVGLLDIAFMAYCIINRISYSSSFNVFAIVAGVSLMRGSLRAASIVHLLSTFMLAAFLTFLFARPFLQPWDLMLTRFRLSPLATLGSIATMFLILGLLIWLCRQLGQESVTQAHIAAGRKIRNLRIVALVGVCLGVVIAAAILQMFSSASAAKAEAMAATQLGPDFKYRVSSLNIMESGDMTRVSANVVAWNNEEIREVPVRWDE